MNPVTNFLDSSRHSTSLVLLHGKQYGELFLTYGLEIAQNKKILSQVQQPYDIAVQTITIFWNINKEITVSVGFTNEYVKSLFHEKMIPKIRNNKKFGLLTNSKMKSKIYL